MTALTIDRYAVRQTGPRGYAVIDKRDGTYFRVYRSPTAARQRATDLNIDEQAARAAAKATALAAARKSLQDEVNEDHRKWGGMPSPYGRITGDEHRRDYYASCGAVAGRL